MEKGFFDDQPDRQAEYENVGEGSLDRHDSSSVVCRRSVDEGGYGDAAGVVADPERHGHWSPRPGQLQPLSLRGEGVAPAAQRREDHLHVVAVDGAVEPQETEAITVQR